MAGNEVKSIATNPPKHDTGAVHEGAVTVEQNQPGPMHVEVVEKPIIVEDSQDCARPGVAYSEDSQDPNQPFDSFPQTLLDGNLVEPGDSGKLETGSGRADVLEQLGAGLTRKKSTDDLSQGIPLGFSPASTPRPSTAPSRTSSSQDKFDKYYHKNPDCS